MSFFYEHESIRAENTYFAAANTKNGFVSFFDEAFGDTRRIIIKGGPGTGKSTIMRAFGERAKEMGYETETYLCSSDTSSVDGVKIPSLSLSVIDGTPPHAEDPRLVGAYDTILNLCDFFDTDKLAHSLTEIRIIKNEISAAYSGAYSLLLSAGGLISAYRETVRPYILTDKIKKAAIKAANGAKGSSVHRQCEAVGVLGSVYLCSLARADETVTFSDRYHISDVFLSLLRAELLSRGIGHEYSLSPTDLSVNTLRIGGSRVFLPCETETPTRVINTERFISPEIRIEKNGLKRLEKSIQSVMQSATELLKRAGAYHKALESIYAASVDFDAYETTVSRLMKRLSVTKE